MSLNNNRLLEVWGYSADRQQLISVSAGGALALGYSYCPSGGSSCNTNNGNLLRQTIGGLIQDYGYTESSGLKLNRLASATETGGSNEWSQNYGYDAFGNRWVSSGMVMSAFTPTASTNFDANNRLQIQNTLYDTAGNQKQIGGLAFGYDAENRQSSSTLNTVITTYSYDGDGRRVMKANGGTTVYVYDAMGELAAEYSTNPSPALCQTCYLTADALGGTRLVTNESAVAVACHDYLPFGEEIPSGTGGRSGCYTDSDGITEKFTGQERDSETGMDYFGARYFAGSQGRFVSPDEPLIDQHPGEPQSWNLYNYVRNNPFRFLDPTGHECVTANDGTVKDNGKGDLTCYQNDATLEPLPLTSSLGQTQDRAVGVVKGFFSLVLDTAEVIGAPPENVNQIKSFFNLYPSSQNQTFGAEIVGIAAMFLPSGEADTLAKAASSAKTGINLKKALASEQQISEILSGGGLIGDN